MKLYSSLMNWPLQSPHTNRMEVYFCGFTSAWEPPSSNKHTHSYTLYMFWKDFKLLLAGRLSQLLWMFFTKLFAQLFPCSHYCGWNFWSNGDRTQRHEESWSSDGVRTQRDTRRAGALMETGLRETRGELELWWSQDSERHEESWSSDGDRTQRDTRRAGALMETGLRETRGELELWWQTLTVYLELRPENSQRHVTGHDLTTR